MPLVDAQSVSAVQPVGASYLCEGDMEVVSAADMNAQYGNSDEVTRDVPKTTPRLNAGIGSSASG